MKCYSQRQQNIFTVVAKTDDAAVQASFSVSEAVANILKPITESEHVKQCITKAAEIMCSETQLLFKTSVFLHIRWSKM
jgi:hypothetical protein